jgi:two-component system cell cycle sensor histidine kinase/response regulator CckA
MSESTSVPARGAGLAEPPRPRALVVEDDDAIRALTARLLCRDGYSVIQATNGREAIDLLRAGNGVDVVVLDLALPEVNGVQVIDYLRSHMPFMLNRVVIVTANVRAFATTLPEEICHILIKPFDIHQFLEAVRSCTRSSQH